MKERDVATRETSAVMPPRRHAVLPVLLLPLFPLLPLAAQTVDTTTPYVLHVPASVRVVGLNEAAVAIVGDAGAVFANPAGLATIRHIALEGGYRAAPGDAFVVSGALGWRLRQFDIGLGGRLFDFGPDPASYLGPSVAPGADARELLGVGSLVYRFGLIALGGSGKVVRRTVGDAVERGVSVDAGLAIAFFDIMALGFAVQNIGGNWRDASSLTLPRLTRLGFTMNYVDPQESFRLMSILEAQWPEDAEARIVVGGEAGVVVRGVGVIGRVGYSGDAAALAASNATYGGSLRIGALSLDYAYRASDLLGRSSHQFGARLTL